MALESYADLDPAILRKSFLGHRALSPGFRLAAEART